MATYRMYFLGRTGAILGRDDFAAESDGSAILIAEVLCAACSDVCDGFELWQGTRRVDESFPMRRLVTVEHIALSAQETVLQREIAIRDSSWVIAGSARLLEQTRRFTQSGDSPAC